MMLRKSLLLFLVFFFCIGGMAHAEFVQNGDFQDQLIGWGTFPLNESQPNTNYYVDTNSDLGNYQGQIGYSTEAPSSSTFAGLYTYTGRIFQNISDSTPAELMSGLEDLTTGVYTINFEANLIDGDGTPGDAENFRFLAYTWDGSNYNEIFNSDLIYGNGNGATGYLPYSYSLDFSGWDGVTGDAYIAFLFNEEEGAAYDTEYFKVDNVSIVPIPGAIWFLGSGLLAIFGSRKGFKKK